MNITVGELKEFIETLEDGVYVIGIDGVNSYRGVYSEPAFTFGANVTKRDMLGVIARCLKEEFEGYRCDYYRYSEGSPVHFEQYGSSTNGDYFGLMQYRYRGSDFFKKLNKWKYEGREISLNW